MSILSNEHGTPKMFVSLFCEGREREGVADHCIKSIATLQPYKFIRKTKVYICMKKYRLFKKQKRCYFALFLPVLFLLNMTFFAASRFAVLCERVDFTFGPSEVLRFAIMCNYINKIC